MVESDEAEQCKQHATKIRKQDVIPRARARRYSRTQQVYKPQIKKQKKKAQGETTYRVTAKLGTTGSGTTETRTSRHLMNYICMHSPACSR